MEAIRQSFQRKFKKIRGLYHPSDTLLVQDWGGFIFGTYRSTRFSIEEGEETYDNCTKILFNLGYHEVGGGIGYLSVHKKLRGDGFGRQMVEAVEGVLEGEEVEGIELEIVDNPEFWKYMGYAPLEENPDLKYQNWIKRFSSLSQ